MTSKQRLLAAVRSEEADHVPLVIGFWPAPRHAMARWSSERERLGVYRAWGWDTTVFCFSRVTPGPDVRVEVAHETDGGRRVLRQTWRTPARTLTERLRATDEWCDVAGHVGLGDDFRTARYLEFPFKTEDDLAALD
jgi:hypothetical protein